MKNIIIVISLLLSSQFCLAADGNGVDNGGDRVEVLFSQAQTKAIDLLNALTIDDIDSLPILDDFKRWLKQNDGNWTKLGKLGIYTRELKLFFVDRPCNEGGAARSTSFDHSDPENPRMCVSISLNLNTTLEQATALIFHEAGHFVGELDHVFLSALGKDLAKLALLEREYTCIPKNLELSVGRDFTNRGIYKVYINAKFPTYYDNILEFSFDSTEKAYLAATYLRSQIHKVYGNLSNLSLGIKYKSTSFDDVKAVDSFQCI